MWRSLAFFAPVECRGRAETGYPPLSEAAAIYGLELPKSIRQGPEALVKTIPTHWRLQLMDLCQYAERKLTAHSGRKWPYDSRLTITHWIVGNTEAIPSSLRVSFDSLNERTAVGKSFKMRGVY